MHGLNGLTHSPARYCATRVPNDIPTATTYYDFRCFLRNEERNGAHPWGEGKGNPKKEQTTQNKNPKGT